MNDLLGAALSFVVGMYWDACWSFGWLASVAFGAVLVPIVRTVASGDERPILAPVLRFVGVALVLLGPAGSMLAPWVAVWSGVWDTSQGELVQRIGLVGHGMLAALGFAAFIAWTRYGSPRINALSHKLTRSSALERNKKTDVRDLSAHLPDVGSPFSPASHIDQRKGMFIGIGEGRRPLYIPLDLWRTSHVDVIGTTGAGKGVASGVLLSQALRFGESVIAIDPKNDEWAPHVLRNAAVVAGVPFYLVDLSADAPAIDLLAGASALEREELLMVGLEISGSAEGGAGYYRALEQRAARWLASQPGHTLAALCSDPASLRYQTDNKDAAALFVRLEALARIRSINAAGGLDLSSVVNGHACLYVIGSMRHPGIIAAQRMLMLRLIQLAERRDRTQGVRPVCVFLDELKYHLSRPALEGLGAARDKGVHFVLAHQSLADLRDCAGLDAEAVTGAIVENTRLKIVYRVNDPATAEWLAAMSGTIQVDDEMRRTQRTAGMSEVVEAERTIRQAERYLVDTNMLLNLPPRCAYVYGSGLPVPAHICPMVVTKSALPRYEAPSTSAPDVVVTPADAARSAIDI